VILWPLDALLLIFLSFGFSHMLYLAKPYVPSLERLNQRKINGVCTSCTYFIESFLNTVHSYLGYIQFFGRNVSLNVILYASYIDLKFCNFFIL
jgi:hypothetical protein